MGVQGVERAGIQSNMLREITMAPLGDVQMLGVRGIEVGSYRKANISWETTRQVCSFHPLYSCPFLVHGSSLTFLSMANVVIIYTICASRHNV